MTRALEGGVQLSPGAVGRGWLPLAAKWADAPFRPRAAFAPASLRRLGLCAPSAGPHSLPCSRLPCFLCLWPRTSLKEAGMAQVVARAPREPVRPLVLVGGVHPALPSGTLRAGFWGVGLRRGDGKADRPPGLFGSGLSQALVRPSVNARPRWRGAKTWHQDVAVAGT